MARKTIKNSPNTLKKGSWIEKVPKKETAAPKKVKRIGGREITLSDVNPEAKLDPEKDWIWALEKSKGRVGVWNYTTGVNAFIKRVGDPSIRGGLMMAHRKSQLNDISLQDFYVLFREMILKEKRSGKRSGEVSWWITPKAKETVTSYTPEGRPKQSEKYIQIRTKSRVPNLLDVFNVISGWEGNPKDMRIIRRPNKQHPNSVLIFGTFVMDRPSQSVKREVKILLTKGSRINEEDLKEMDKRFLLFNKTRVTDVTPAAEKQMRSFSPVGERANWVHDPARYQDYTTTRTQEGPNTDKKQQAREIEEGMKRFTGKVTRY